VARTDVGEAADRRSVELLSTASLDERLTAEGMCRGMDTEAWYPLVHITQGSVSSRTEQKERRYAAALCAGCPVTAECLELALRIPAGMYGVWGATSERDRRALRRQRAAEAAVTAAAEGVA
jgi:WhiB family redox-sensing transcriptional regulator